MNNSNQRSCSFSNEYEKELEKMSPFEIKNQLIEMAKEDAKKSTHTFLNAGRGNPNWIATYPRKAFFLLGEWALQECLRVANYQVGIASIPSRQNISDRFKQFISSQKNCRGAKLLEETFEYLIQKGADPNELALEWAEGVIGDQYPTPDRILRYTEILIQDYLTQEMGSNNNTCNLDLFACEGGTAGMCYAFDSLQQNKLLQKGDTIALMTPIFTPYIEIPKLDRFNFNVIEISANKINKEGFHTWQYADEEIDKLRDKRIKLLCLVNPSNPPSYTLSRHTLDRIVEIVKTDNPNLMIITDDVYGTFVKDFHSLMYELPENTLCVYSFSKYFGATGWRLAVIAVNKNNIFDRMIKELSHTDKQALSKRYGSLTLTPEKLKFIDRLVADSRLVALNHTAGLSTPQQIQMSLFAAFALLDKKNDYKTKMQSIISSRLEALWKTTGFTLIPDELRAGYYSEIDIMVWAHKLYGEDFCNYLKAHYEPIDFVIRLAKETAIVLLNGDGFDGPLWSIRASLANLDEQSYLQIGTAIRKILDEYHAYYLCQK
jgi:aspartate 4-decarboxylase